MSTVSLFIAGKHHPQTANKRTAFNVKLFRCSLISSFGTAQVISVTQSREGKLGDETRWWGHSQQNVGAANAGKTHVCERTLVPYDAVAVEG